MWLVNWFIIEDKQLNVWVTQFLNLRFRLGNRARIILATNSDDLNQIFWVVEIIDLLDGSLIHIFFMASRQEDGKRQLRRQINIWCAIELGVICCFPYETAH